MSDYDPTVGDRVRVTLDGGVERCTKETFTLRLAGGGEYAFRFDILAAVERLPSARPDRPRREDGDPVTAAVSGAESRVIEAMVEHQAYFSPDWRAIDCGCGEGGFDTDGFIAHQAAVIAATFPAAPAMQPLIRGRCIAHVHTCGAVEYLAPEDRIRIGGGCDACESGSEDPLDWRPVFVAAS